MPHSYHLPGTILMGAGALHKLPEQLARIPGTTALLVTDEGIVAAGIARQVQEVLEGAGMRVVLYEGVQPDPDLKQVAAGVGLYCRQGCELVVAVGGGSPIDCAKGIVLAAARVDGEGCFMKQPVPIPFIAVPTTAGTGSEATKYLVITDPEREKKLVLNTPGALPWVAVCDARLTLQLPPKLTAATGIDALTHAVEAYLSTCATPLTDALALRAVAMIGSNLLRAVKEGSALPAREAMLEAQFLAGLAFSNAGVGYVHALAHALGGLFHIPHGIANGLMLPVVMAYNLPVRAPRLEDIARALGADCGGVAGRLAGRRAIAAVKGLRAEIGLPRSLREVGVKEKDLPRLAAMAAGDPTGTTAPRPATAAELEELFRQALEGEEDG